MLLPKKNKNCDRVIQYLFGRGIDYQLIQDCVADGTIFKNAEYHNAVHVGKDESGTPKYAACRSTLGSSFMEMQLVHFRGCYDSVGYLKKAGIL